MMSYSSSSIRAFGASLVRLSNGLLLKSPTPFPLQGKTPFHIPLLYIYTHTHAHIYVYMYIIFLKDLIYLCSGSVLMSKNLSFSSCLSSSAERVYVNSSELLFVRKIWSATPLCMGRRSSKIAGRKVFVFCNVVCVCVWDLMFIDCRNTN